MLILKYILTQIFKLFYILTPNRFPWLIILLGLLRRFRNLFPEIFLSNPADQRTRKVLSVYYYFVGSLLDGLVCCKFGDQSVGFFGSMLSCQSDSQSVFLVQFFLCIFGVARTQDNTDNG